MPGTRVRKGEQKIVREGEREETVGERGKRQLGRERGKRQLGRERGKRQLGRERGKRQLGREREESQGGRRIAATYVEEGYMTTPPSWPASHESKAPQVATCGPAPRPMSVTHFHVLFIREGLHSLVLKWLSSELSGRRGLQGMGGGRTKNSGCGLSYVELRRKGRGWLHYRCLAQTEDIVEIMGRDLVRRGGRRGGRRVNGECEG